LISSLSQSITEIKKRLNTTTSQVEKRFKRYETTLRSPFVPTAKSALAISGIAAQIQGLQLRIKDCERLEELCR